MPRLRRRGFLLRSTMMLGSGCLVAPKSGSAAAPTVLRTPKHPVVVASANGHPACVQTALEKILAGTPAVDAVVAGVTLVEDDPSDHSVGLGGLPNEDGEVELDASVMDGKSGLAGAVCSLRRIRNPSQVALAVMRYTDHVLLAGEGARAFARAHGFVEQELLTPEAREIWLYWKSTMSDKDDWLPKTGKDVPANVKAFFGITGTINCCAVDRDGNLAGVTTTSGLAFKIPGRVGDSPLVGAGLFVDNGVGAAGSTGRGEANIVTAGSHTVVEFMRAGKHPKDACLAACKRIVESTRAPRLLRADGKPDFNVNYYAVDKQGRYGGAALFDGGSFAVCDAKGPRTEKLEGLFDR
ncbi:MAG: N(4)-(beta-N-acetylglucosaminyl)-L-asparaginase [Nannocystaceae bacterium]